MKPTVLIPFFALVAACHYDWSVGPRPDEGADGGGADASLEAGDEGASVDAPGAETSQTQCDLLEAQVHYAYLGIANCGKTCTQSLRDECGCLLSVEDATSAAAQNYVAAVKAWNDAQCTKNCATCATPKYACAFTYCI
jgi:hypothetical protein